MIRFGFVRVNGVWCRLLASRHINIVWHQKYIVSLVRSNCKHIQIECTLENFSLRCYCTFYAICSLFSFFQFVRLNEFVSMNTMAFSPFIFPSIRSILLYQLLAAATRSFWNSTVYLAVDATIADICFRLMVVPLLLSLLLLFHFELWSFFSSCSIFCSFQSSRYFSTSPKKDVSHEKYLCKNVCWPPDAALLGRFFFKYRYRKRTQTKEKKKTPVALHLIQFSLCAK